MRKYLYTIIFCLLVCSVTSNAQLEEHVYVYTDKSCYHAGEIMWFRADVAESKSSKPLDVSKVAYIELLDMLNKPVLQGKIGLRDASGNGSFDIPQSVRSGRYLLRAYTNWMKNFSPETYFHKQITIINVADSITQIPTIKSSYFKKDIGDPEQWQITASTDKQIYSIREKLILNISSSTDANLSVAVFKIDSLQQADELVMDNTSSRNFTGSMQSKFPPEYYGHIITGKIVESGTGRPAFGKTGYLSVPGTKHYFDIATSDSAGNFFIDKKDFYGVNEVVLHTGYKADTNYHIELNNPFSTEYVPLTIDTQNLFFLYKEDIVLHGVSAQVQNIYNDSLRNIFGFPEMDTLSLYGTPDNYYRIDDYVKFTTMEDVLREYVREIGVRRKEGKLAPFVFDKQRRKGFSNNPFTLVNGVPLFDMNKFMAIDPALVSTIEVVDWKYFRGKNSIDGIVSMTTKNRSVNDFEMDPNAMVINYEGLQPERKFYSPLHANISRDRMPDFRNVLYWNPMIRTGKESHSLTFYTSDLKGKYAVVIAGRTDNGEMGKKVLVINVE